MAQVALALVLIVSSVLMIRTFEALRTVEPGFTDPQSCKRCVSGSRRRSGATRRASSAWRTRSPTRSRDPGRRLGRVYDSTADGRHVRVLGQHRRRGPAARRKGRARAPLRKFKFVSPGVFRALGTRLVAGRELERADLDDNRPVALVSENLARELWREPAAALGKRIRHGGGVERDRRRRARRLTTTASRNRRRRPRTGRPASRSSMSRSPTWRFAIRRARLPAARRSSARSSRPSGR